MKILVVDDDEFVRASIRRILVRECDADVSAAKTGLEALDFLTRHECDLVLLDLQMPDLDGMKTLQAIRRSPNRQTLPVVMLTGTADEAKVRESLSLGVQAYLLKPVQPEALVSRLSEIIVHAFAAQSATNDPPKVLKLRKRNHVVLIEPDGRYLEFVSRQLGKYCRVESFALPVPALRALSDRSPSGVVLGGQIDTSATTRVLARARTHPRLKGVPIFALVPPDALAKAPEGFDGALSRTLDQDVWTSGSQSIVVAMADAAKYLETAIEHTVRAIASLGPGEVTRISNLRRENVIDWLSASVDFDADERPWRLTLVTPTTSARELAKRKAGKDQLPEQPSTDVLRAFARSAVEAVVALDNRGGRTPRIQCDITPCVGPPAATGEDVVGQEWVVVLQHEITVLVRMQERRHEAAPSRSSR